MKDKQYILPRFIRFRDAAHYLGMDKNRFNREVRPNITQIPIGKQGIAFDRLDLDQWAEQYKQRVSWPTTSNRGELWVEDKKYQDSSNVVSTGTSKRRSLDDEYDALLAPSRLKKPRPSSHVK